MILHLSRRCFSFLSSLHGSGKRDIYSILNSPTKSWFLGNKPLKTLLQKGSFSTNTNPASPHSELYSNLIPTGLNRKLQSGLVLWFGASSLGVASLIILGGITRLTRSGLSMTEWSFAGERPPMHRSDWIEEFAKYQQSPEFKKVNRSIALEEFKFIYWMEYAHRMWGRCLGLMFGLPAVYFTVRRAVSPVLGRRIGLLMLMGGTQGLVGWWMVRSGLKETQDDSTIPRVSPYRLAAHLTSAFTIYSILLWTTYSLKKPYPVLKAASNAIRSDSRKLLRFLVPLSGLVGVTAVSGAFVAGNDAGRCYNTFPKMNGKWIPEDYFTTKFLSMEHFFENSASVQLHHRILAVTTGLSCIAIYFKSRRMELLPISCHYLAGLAAFAVGQMGLGITALLQHVPTWVGSAHQFGALVLITLITGSFHHLRVAPPSRIGKFMSGYGPGIAACGVVGAGLWVTQMQ